LIRWEDQLREHPFYTRAALAAVKLYLKIYDKPLSNGVNGNASETAEDAVERKKAAKKARKEAEKAAKDAAAKKAEPNKVAKDPEGIPKKVDEDPNGAKLAATTEPLKDAMKFVTYLLQFSPKSIEAQLAGFEVFIRRGKYLLALRCLLASAALDSEHPTVHEQIVRFKQAIDSSLDGLPALTAEVIKSEFTLLPASNSLSHFNSDFLAKHKDSPGHVLSAARIQRLLAPDARAAQEKDVVAILDLPRISLEDAREGLDLLSSWKSSEASSYHQKAGTKWPEAIVFQSKA